MQMLDNQLKKITQHYNFQLLGIVLVNSGCHNEIPKIRQLKQKGFISHSSQGWEVQDHGVSQFCSLTKAHFLASTFHLVTVSSNCRERGGALVSVILLKDINPILGALCSSSLN